LAASRLGRGTFGLASTQLAQARVPATERATFAGVEISLGQIFGLVHSLATATWSSPRDYGWLACVSFGAVAISASMYTKWFIRERKEERELGRSLRETNEDGERQYGTFEAN
jgi:solute carrier family 40 (iron-regulated transporter), member 1